MPGVLTRSSVAPLQEKLCAEHAWLWLAGSCAGAWAASGVAPAPAQFPACSVQEGGLTYPCFPSRTGGPAQPRSSVALSTWHEPTHPSEGPLLLSEVVTEVASSFVNGPGSLGE